VVSEPVTDYIRFEHATTGSNLVVGEDVRWLPRHLATGLLLPANDYWVFPVSGRSSITFPVQASSSIPG
jgi:hypothetical protein